jgi:hypothetical protein
MACVDPQAVRIGEPGMGAADPALARPQLGKIRAATIDYDNRAEARMQGDEVRLTRFSA